MPKLNNPRKIDIPIDVDPRTVVGDHTALTVPREAFARLHDGWLKLKDAAERVKDSDKLAKEARAHVDRLAAAAKADNDRIWAGYRHLRDKIAASVEPTRTDTVAPEIRAWLSKQESPVTAALNAVREGDRRIVAAILTAPAQLSGLTRDEVTNIREQAGQVYEPEDYAAMEQLEKQGVRHGEYIDRFEKEARAKITLWETGDDDAIKEIFANA